MKTQHLLASTGIATCLLAMAFASSQALAEWDDNIIILDTIIVSTSRSEEKLRETPNAISVINIKEVEHVNFVDSRKELLSRIPGNSMIRNLRIPIGGANYTINLVDGLAVRGLGRGTNAFIDESNVSDIERVEVIKGPASSLYGSNAIGGVINVITRKPPKELEASVWAEGGSWGRKRAGISAAGSVNENLGFFFDANIAKMDGWQDRKGIDHKRVSAKLMYEYGEGSTVTVRGEHLDLFNENPGTLSQAQYDANWRQAGVLDAFTDQKLTSFSTIVDHKFSEKSAFKISYGLRHFEEKGPPSYSATGAFGDDNGLTHNLVPQYQHNIDFLNSQIIFGVDLMHDDIKDRTLTGRTPGSPVDADFNVLGVQKSPFTQLQFRPVNWMKVTLGARYDNVDLSINGTDIIGGVLTTVTGKRKFKNLSKNTGVTFNLNENNSLWFGYGEGFVVPSRTALWTSTRSTTNPNLKPETAKNYAIGVRGAVLDGKLGYDVSLYNTTITDMVIDNDDIGAIGAYENAGKARFRGLETSLSFQPLEWLGLSAAYTYAQNKYIAYFAGTGDDFSGNSLSASPLHHLNARIILTPTVISGFRAELEWDYISKYHTSSSNADPLGKYKRPDLLHLRASYNHEHFKIQGSIRNLTNVKHPERISYTGPSRWSPGGRSFTSGEARTFVLRAALKL